MALIFREISMQSKPQYDPERVGQRLEKIRINLELGNQTEFAGMLGVARARYHNWIGGGVLCPVKYAAKLKDMTGVTLDYIYCDDASSLPLKVARALGADGSAE